MRNSRYLLGALAFALVVALAALLLRPRSPEPVRSNERAADKGPAPSPITDRLAPPSEGGMENEANTSETLRLLGTVQSGARVTLTARMPARIVAVRVKEGEHVRSGQILAMLDDAEIRGQARTAEAGVAAAQAQLRKAQAGKAAQRVKADSDVATAEAGLQQAQGKARQARLGMEAARAEAQNERKLAQEGVRKAEVGLQRARETLHGLEALSTVGGVSRSDLEGARSQVTVAESDLETARTQLRRLEAGPESQASLSYRVALAAQDVEAAELGVRQAQEGVRSAVVGRTQALAVVEQDIRAAAAAVAQAQAGAATAREAFANARMTTPIAGVASGVLAKTGETAQPGMPLVTITSLEGLRVEALVPARQLSLLRVGQAAQVRVDTQSERVLPALVSEIAQSAESDGRTFRVQFRFRERASLRPGQTARILLLPARSK